MEHRTKLAITAREQGTAEAWEAAQNARRRPAVRSSRTRPRGIQMDTATEQRLEKCKNLTGYNITTVVSEALKWYALAVEQVWIRQANEESQINTKRFDEALRSELIAMMQTAAFRDPLTIRPKIAARVAKAMIDTRQSVKDERNSQVNPGKTGKMKTKKPNPT